MLVLSRKVHQSFLVGDDVEITVVEIRGNKVRIGIEAPIDVEVDRREIHDIIKREGKRRKKGE